MDSAVEPRHRQAAPSDVLHLVQNALPGNDGRNGSARSPISKWMVHAVVVCDFCRVSQSVPVFLHTGFGRVQQ